MSTAPRLLLVDEPTSRLDEPARDRLLDLLLEVTEARVTAAVVVTHDVAVADRMDRVIHLRDGRVAEEGTDRDRYAVLGADGAIQLPDSVRQSGWEGGTLVAVDVLDEGRILLRRMNGGPSDRSNE